MTDISTTENRLYELLPALYRIADAEANESLGTKGGELRALLALITSEADALHDATQQLWDDFFIETCQPWVIPYIAELVGNTLLHDLDGRPAAKKAQSLFPDLSPDLRAPGAIPLRADVAKTIYYRRRKSTPAMLEELARDVTGWGAHLVEFFTLLRWDQHLEHLRLDNHACPDLRRIDLGDRAGGAWDTTSHTVDVRQINSWDGWYNIPNIGFFLWRLGAYRLRNVRARAIGGDPWRLTFSPLGQDIHLFSSGRREANESGLATELHIEGPIRPVAFFEDILSVPGVPKPEVTDYYGDPEKTEASLVVFKNGAAVVAGDVLCTNLSDWNLAVPPTDNKVRIDVRRGRLTVPVSWTQNQAAITVSYYTGFSAPMGGGEYSRSKWLVPSTEQPVFGGGNALATAIAATPRAAVIQIKDNDTYVVPATITLAAGEELTIQAIDEARPHLLLTNGSLSVLTAGPGASLTLGGLLIEGGLSFDGDLEKLRLLHTTLVPNRSVLQEVPVPPPPSNPSIIVAPGTNQNKLNTRLKVQIAYSIVGALRIPSESGELTILDSIVDGTESDAGPPSIAISDAAGTSGPMAHIERSTIFGETRFLKLDYASESIFTGIVIVDEQQEGCVRFSYLPPKSATPQQYRCQPALQVAAETERKKPDALKKFKVLPPGWDQALADGIARWLVPSFTSTRYGDYAFAQLHLSCPVQIRTGAEDGSEMGAFCLLKQPQRESNLRLRLDEYLPIGLEAGIIYVT